MRKLQKYQIKERKWRLICVKKLWLLLACKLQNYIDVKTFDQKLWNQPNKWQNYQLSKTKQKLCP